MPGFAKPSPWWLLALALCWPAAELGMLLHNTRPGIESTTWAMKWLTDCKANRACLTSQLLATTGAVRASSVQSFQASKALAQSASQVHGLVVEIRPHVVAAAVHAEEAARELPVLLRAATATMNEFARTVGDLRSELKPIMESTNDDLKKLGASLDNVDRLTAALTAEMEKGGDVAGALQALRKATDSFAGLLDDPAIKSTLASTAKTSEHLAGAAESVDIAMRPWRKKASQLKMILTKAAGMLKLTYGL